MMVVCGSDGWTRAHIESFPDLVARGAFRPLVDRVFPLSEAGQAMAHLKGRKTLGKVVVKP